MQTITVEAERKYDVIISEGLLAKAGCFLSRQISPSVCAVVTDDTVDALYSDALIASLNKEEIRCVKFVIPHGEKSKNAENYLALLDFFSESHLTRADAVIALGGGVVGDLAGFAAATYMRGCKLVHIPTTLLAMVDPSVGGKCAIDLRAGKNMCGTFYSPHLVLCDTDLLKTLPAEAFLDGCAEIIKYGCIADPALLEYLEKCGRDFDDQYVISQCVKIKSDIVFQDEFDSGVRRILNFGHTVAHALEKASDYRISHGRAVAIGMAVIAESSAHEGLCLRAVRDGIITLLKRFGFELHHGFEPEELFKYIGSDKKRDTNGITVVLPYMAGQARLIKTEPDKLYDFLRFGVQVWK